MQSKQSTPSTPYMHRCGHVYARFIDAHPPKNRMMICDQCLEPMPVCDEHRNAYRYELHVPKTLAQTPRAPHHAATELDVWASALVAGGPAKSMALSARR